MSQAVATLLAEQDEIPTLFGSPFASMDVTLDDLPGILRAVNAFANTVPKLSRYHVALLHAHGNGPDAGWDTYVVRHNDTDFTYICSVKADHAQRRAPQLVYEPHRASDNS